MSAERVLASQGFSNATPLGQGTYGAVFACTSALGENVAVKVSFDADARITAKREADMMAAIPSHKNVLPVVSFKNGANYTLTALPLATGGDTLKLMQERNCEPLADTEVQSLFTQLVDAVDHMHSNGFVHRDIKCENILLTGARRRDILLADFGFATRTQPGELLNESWGSLHYSAPEICAHIAYDGSKVDIWSMGVVLFAWATGRLAFGGNTDEETAARIMAGLFAIPSTVSPALADLIRRMLTVDPRKRITIAEIREHEWMQAANNVRLALPRSTSQVLAISPVVAVPQKQRRNSVAITAPLRVLRALFRQH